jgi:hypothetical protein
MEKTLNTLLFALVVSAAGTACTATGSAHYRASATMPSMVYIGPDVQVIEDYDEPVFYSSNVYWRYNGGVWYQSRSHTGGWVRVRTTPPTAIVRIQQPAMYVHYRASAHGGAQTNASAQQEHHETQAEHREEKREEKEERREDKQERHDDKHERGHKK